MKSSKSEELTKTLVTSFPILFVLGTLTTHDESEK